MKKYDYYKFPGGGIEEKEDILTALIRETEEETGLVIKENSIKEYGYVYRILKSTQDETVCFIQDNFYYIFDVEDKISN